GGHGVDLRQVAAGGIGQLEPGEVGLHDVLVPLDGEDQRDVDADALTDGRGDRGQARLGGRDLDEQVLRPTTACRCLTCSMVRSVSWARRGSTSMLTRPST